jgi:hypothetical protein
MQMHKKQIETIWNWYQKDKSRLVYFSAVLDEMKNPPWVDVYMDRC